MIDSGGPISRENTGAEIHCTITTIAESPLVPGIIWVGTDDGLVWITRDGGQRWTNLTKNIPGLPPNTWCSRMEASHFDSGTAYACFDGHRQDNYGIYVYMTSDHGQTWKSIKGNLPFGWVNVIREDPRNPQLLYVGTEFGLFASLDKGESWFSLKNNLPTVAVHDINIPSLTAYSISWEQALRGGPINMILINLASSLTGYPGPPTQTDQEQLKELERVIFSLADTTNEILLRMSALNQDLGMHGFNPMKIPEKIKD